LLGSEGLALKERRENNARTNLSAAEMLKERRASALAGLLEMDNNFRGSKLTRAAGAQAIGLSTVPAIGITGADAINLSKENTNLANQITMSKGNIAAGKAEAKYGMYAGMLSSVGSAFTGGAGGAVAGAAGGGAGGGIGSWIGGLFQKKQAPQSPYALGPGY
jgi:hypothetical protein